MLGAHRSQYHQYAQGGRHWASQAPPADVDRNHILFVPCGNRRFDWANAAPAPAEQPPPIIVPDIVRSKLSWDYLRQHQQELPHIEWTAWTKPTFVSESASTPLPPRALPLFDKHPERFQGIVLCHQLPPDRASSPSSHIYPSAYTSLIAPPYTPPTPLSQPLPIHWQLPATPASHLPPFQQAFVAVPDPEPEPEPLPLSRYGSATPVASSSRSRIGYPAAGEMLSKLTPSGTSPLSPPPPPPMLVPDLRLFRLVPARWDDDDDDSFSDGEEEERRAGRTSSHHRYIPYPSTSSRAGRSSQSMHY